MRPSPRRGLLLVYQFRQCERVRRTSSFSFGSRRYIMRRFSLVVLLAFAPLPAQAADDWVGETVFPTMARLPLRDAGGKSIGSLSYDAVVLREFDEWIEVRHVIYPGPYIGRVKKTEVVKLADAEMFFTGKIKANPKDTWAYRNRAAVRVMDKDYDGAIDDLTDAIEIDPHFSLFVERGRTKRAKGDLDGAIKDYGEALKLEPKDAVAFNNRGVVWEAKGKLDNAIDDYTSAIDADPKYSTPYRNRGLAQQKKGDYGPAIKDFNEAVKLDPNNALTLDDLAWLLSTCPDATLRDGKRAVTFAKKACELTEWKNMVLIETLAAAYAETGDFDKAIDYQKKAMDNADYMKKYGAEVRARMKLYESGKPVRLTSPKAPVKPAPSSKATLPHSQQG